MTLHETETAIQAVLDRLAPLAPPPPRPRSQAITPPAPHPAAPLEP